MDVASLVQIEKLIPAAAYLGAGIAMGLGAIGSGVGEGYTAGLALEGITRQKSQSGNVLKTMLIGQAVAESPGIFSLFIAIMLLFSGLHATWVQAFSYIGAGIAVGASAIGSGVGCGLIAARASRGIARQPESIGKVTVYMLVSQALADSTFIFGLFVGLLLIFVRSGGEGAPAIIQNSARLLAAGVSMGFGAVGCGVGCGICGGEACRGMSGNLENLSPIANTMFLGIAVSQSTAIYSLVVSVILIFVAQ
jgi:ATP synthase F0 subunit c